MKTDWIENRVDRLFELGRGRVINFEEIENNRGDYPVYSSQTENNGVMGRVNFYEFDGEYITWTTDGANAGTVTYRSGRFNCTNVCGTLKAKNEKVDEIDPQFIAYQLQRSAFKYVAVVGNNKLMNNVMARIRISFPKSKAEQSLIARYIVAVENLIEATKTSIDKAERVKKSLMQKLLSGKLRPDGSIRSKNDFCEDEKYGLVPMGWNPGKLGDIAEIIAGQSPEGSYYNSEGIGTPMLNGPTEFTDLYPKPIQFTTKVTRLCEKGDILFTVRGSSTGRMNIADREYCIGRGIAAIRNKENSDIDFIHYTLFSIAEKILAEARGAGSTFPNVNRTELLKKKIIYPDYDVQKMIAEKINAVKDLTIIKQEKLEKLEKLKKSLMQNLLTGKVRVKI